VLLIVSSAAAQATQPVTRHEFQPFPYDSAPSAPRGEEVSGVNVFAKAIRARNAIQSIEYRAAVIRQSQRPAGSASYTSVQRIRGNPTCFLIEIEGEYRGPGPNNSPITDAWSHVVLVHPKQLFLWRVGMSNPQRVYTPVHPNWQPQAGAIEGGLTQAFVLQRWGFAWMGRTLESGATDQRLRFHRVSERADTTAYEVWYQSDTAEWNFGSLIETHNPSGLIVRTFGYSPDGRPHMATECILRQFADASDASASHWIPVSLHSERAGERFDATISDVVVNGDFDCDSLIAAAEKRLTTENTKIFEMLSNGNTQGLVFREGAWVDDGLGELPLSADHTPTPQAVGDSSTTEMTTDLPPAGVSRWWIAMALLGGSLLLITLALVTMARNRRST
jgi:hypothetical protein